MFLADPVTSLTKAIPPCPSALVALPYRILLYFSSKNGVMSRRIFLTAVFVSIYSYFFVTVPNS